MQNEINKLKAECKRVERHYASRRKSERNLQSAMENAKLASEFMKKDANQLIQFANKILESSESEDVKLKNELENIIKKSVVEISQKIISG